MCEVQGEEGGRRGEEGDVPLYHSIFFVLLSPDTSSGASLSNPVGTTPVCSRPAAATG